MPPLKHLPLLPPHLPPIPAHLIPGLIFLWFLPGSDSFLSSCSSPPPWGQLSKTGWGHIVVATAVPQIWQRPCITNAPSVTTWVPLPLIQDGLPSETHFLQGEIQRKTHSSAHISVASDDLGRQSGHVLGPAPSLGVDLVVKSKFYRFIVTPNAMVVPSPLEELSPM